MDQQRAEDTVSLLEGLLKLSEVSKIQSTFIPVLRNAHSKALGTCYTRCVHGGFNLGGTKSGRLSSSKPNLQQIPSTGTKYAKPVKQCFIAPVGWLMVGADYASLEDRISALMTRDPEKLKVYTDGYDGHCLRAYSYFQSQMPDITQELAEIDKPGKTFKITHDDGTVEYLNETNLQKRLKEVLDYNPNTGVFTWKLKIADKVCIDKRAGQLKANGYRFIGIDKGRYREHRLALLYMTGHIPTQVDHINHIGKDNRWCNLRAADYKINGKNQPKTRRNTSNCVGVSQYKDGLYRATIYTAGKHIRLGKYQDFFEACCARKSAEIRFGFHPNHGR